MSERNNHIDFLKGFAIYTVVLGHCWMRSDFLYWFIYRFHMVFFMLISGYLFSAKRPFLDFLLRKAKALLVPYVIFSLVSMAVNILFLGGEVEKIPTYLFGMAMGGKFCLTYRNFTLWYLPLIFFTSLIMYFVVKKSGKFYNLIMILAFLVTVPFNRFMRNICDNGYIPFSVQVIPVALLCMMIGYRLKEKGYDGYLLKNKYANFILAIALGLAGFFLSVDSWATVINPYRYLLIPAAVLICHMIVVLTKNFRSKTVCFWGVNSLYILGTHRGILYLLQKRTNLEDFLIKNGIDGAVACLLISIVVISLISAIIFAVRYLQKSLACKKGQ